MTVGSINWDDGALVTVDQRALPGEVRVLRITTVDQLIEAISTLAIRGAPALGTLEVLHGRGAVETVLVDETRPLLQGARLTTWELAEAGIPHRLTVDSAAAWAMATGQVDCVIVGADRIAADGSVANKIGTYALALAARHHGLPFIVVAPESTRDPATATGADIVVEQRAAAEITHVGEVITAPEGTAVFNPAFDVTPPQLVTAVVTDNGVLGDAGDLRGE